MSGFLKVPQKGLNGSQKRLYQSHFCGGCHALHGESGRRSSLLTNYDITFWTLLGTGLQPQALMKQLNCAAVPWRKVLVHELSPDTRTALAPIISSPLNSPTTLSMANAVFFWMPPRTARKIAPGAASMLSTAPWEKSGIAARCTNCDSPESEPEPGPIPSPKEEEEEKQKLVADSPALKAWRDRRQTEDGSEET